MLNYWILYGSCMACKSAIKSQGCAVIYHRFQWHISLPLRLCNSLRRPYSVMIVTSALELVSSQLINTALLFFFLIDVGVSSHNDLCTGQSSRVPLVVNVTESAREFFNCHVDRQISIQDRRGNAHLSANRLSAVICCC